MTTRMRSTTALKNVALAILLPVIGSCGNTQTHERMDDELGKRIESARRLTDSLATLALAAELDSGGAPLPSELFQDSPFKIYPEELESLRKTLGARADSHSIGNQKCWHRFECWLPYMDSQPTRYGVTDSFSTNDEPPRLFWLGESSETLGLFAIASTGPDGEWSLGVTDYLSLSGDQIQERLRVSDDIVSFAKGLQIEGKDIVAALELLRTSPLPYEPNTTAPSSLEPVFERLEAIRQALNYSPTSSVMSFSQEPKHEKASDSPYIPLLRTDLWMAQGALGVIASPSLVEGVRYYLVQDDIASCGGTEWIALIVVEGPDGVNDFLPEGEVLFRSMIESSASVWRNGEANWDGKDIVLPIYKMRRLKPRQSVLESLARYEQ